MTREEAITIIERLAHTEAKWPGTEDTLEALDMALAALRPVSRERVERMQGEWIDLRECYNDVPKRQCSHCGKVLIGLETPFCEACGAPMTDEAVQMVMERLEALKDGVD